LPGRAALESVVQAAVQRVTSFGRGVILGLGTSQTSAAFIERLATTVGTQAIEAVIPTSIQAESRATSLGFRAGSLYNYLDIDIYVDSFDQCDIRGDLIKGMGGALAREKLLMSLAKNVLLIGTEEKLSDRLKAPVPLEVIPFAAPAASSILRSRGWKACPKVSEGKAGPVITDNGNLLMLVEVGEVEEPEEMERELKMIPGVVEVGIFPNKGYRVLIGLEDGRVREIK